MHAHNRIEYEFICVVCGDTYSRILPEDTVMMHRVRKTCSKKCYNQAISKKAIIRIEKSGHPKGMLGKTHSAENKAKMSRRFKAMWLDPNSKLNSEANKQRVSDNNVKLHKKGILGGNSMYSSGKKAWFYDGDKKYFMRSSWETIYAAFLNTLKKGSAIQDWQYEVDTFWFEEIKRGVRSYKPDFKIFNNDGTIEYHEVKGYMDKKSKTKIKRMAKYYPKVKLIIKDEGFFKKNKHILPSYELAIKMYGSNNYGE